MSLTTTETFGFSDEFVQFLIDHKAELLPLGLDVTTWITDIQAKKGTAVAKDQAQEAGKATLKTLTTETEAALTALYNTVSSRIDAAAGAAGKTTPMGKQILNIRSKVRRGPGPGPVPTPSP